MPKGSCVSTLELKQLVGNSTLAFICKGGGACYHATRQTDLWHLGLLVAI